MKSLFKTVFIIIIFSVITRLIGFLFRIYISRTIGAQALGEYQVSFSIFMVLLTVISSGLPFIISRLTAKFIADKDNTSEHKMVTAGLVIGLLLSIILCAIVLAFLPVLKIVFTDDRCIIILLILLPALVFSSIYSALRGNIWGKNKFLLLSLTELFEQIIRVVIFVLLIKGAMRSTDGAYISAVSLTIACLLSAIMVLIIYFATGGKIKFGKAKNLYRELIKKSAPITGVRIATSLIQPLIALIIPMRLVSAGYTSAQALSMYGIAMGMTLPFLFIPSTVVGSLSTALVPDLSTATSKNDMEYITARVKSSVKFTLFISILFIPIYLGAGSFIGKFFYGNIESGVMLERSCWILLPLGLTNISSALLNSLGYEIKSMRNYILGAILLLLSVWFLPKYLGIYALIWAFGLCFGATAILNFKMLRKVINDKIGITKPLWLEIAFIIPSASICSFLSNILSHFMPLFFNLAISCTISALFFISLCFVFNIIEVNSLIIKIKHTFHKKRLKKRKKGKIAFKIN